MRSSAALASACPQTQHPLSGSSPGAHKREGSSPTSSAPHPTVFRRSLSTDLIRPSSDGIRSETVGVRSECVENPPRPASSDPRLPTVIGPGRMWSDDVSCRRRRPETRTYSETPSKIDRSQILVPPPTVIRPFTTVFTSSFIRPSSDRDRTRGRMTSNTPGRQCPPSLFRPSSDRLPSEDGRMRSVLASGRNSEDGRKRSGIRSGWIPPL